MKLSFDTQKGSSNLLLVLIMGMILMLLSTATLLYTYLSTKIATQQVNVLQAEYAAEGVLLDTADLIQSGVWPPTLPFSDIFELPDGTKVYREVEATADGIKLTVTSSEGDSNRSFSSIISNELEGYTQLDIVLVIDRSLSMAQNNSLDFAKQAASNFVTRLFDENLDVRIGLIVFQNYPILLEPFTDQQNLIIQRIQDPGVIPEGGTNISAALSQANNLLQQARPSAKPIILFFSDGVPNHYLTEPSGFPNPLPQNIVCQNDDCISPTFTNMAPADMGNYCTNEASAILAQQLKNSGSTIYSVSLTSNYGLQSITNPSIEGVKTNTCLTDWQQEGVTDQNEVLNKVKELGSRTLLYISSEPDNNPIYYDPNQEREYFKQTTSSEELDEIFQSIADSIITSAKFSYLPIDSKPIPTE